MHIVTVHDHLEKDVRFLANILSEPSGQVRYCPSCKTIIVAMRTPNTEASSEQVIEALAIEVLRTREAQDHELKRKQTSDTNAVGSI